MIAAWRPESFLDVGCGTGRALEYVAAQGIECAGLEGSEAAIRSSPVSQLIARVNLNKCVSLGRSFDLVWSYEVAEHIHPNFVETYLDTLTSHGDRIALSAAPPGQGGVGHFNEQPQRYWIEKLERRGFAYRPELSTLLHGLDDLWCENMMLFIRQR